jgi:DNA-directed RNA polymerase specialized sigma24 family protein
MNHPSLTGVLERLARGDTAAVADVHRVYGVALRRWIQFRFAHQLQPAAVAEVLLQTLCFDLVRRSKTSRWQFENSAQLWAYLVKVANSRFIDMLRRERRGAPRRRSGPTAIRPRAPATSVALPAQDAEAAETWAWLLARCFTAHRDILRLKRTGYALEEIARRTSLHPGSVRRILYYLACELAARP